MGFVDVGINSIWEIIEECSCNDCLLIFIS